MSLRNKIHIGGFVPFSSKDFPGYLSAVIFLQGCAWKCGYCHNPHLIPCRGTGEILFEQIQSFLEKRIGLLDAVVFSGGEPTLQFALPEVLEIIKKMGFKIGLHTNGAFPNRLRKALPWVDWVAIDAKTEFSDYAQITEVKGSGENALKSIQLILESKLPYEVRTTVLPRLHPRSLVLDLAKKLASMGVRNYAIQTYRSQGINQSNELDSESLQKLEELFETFTYRN